MPRIRFGPNWSPLIDITDITPDVAEGNHPNIRFFAVFQVGFAGNKQPERERELGFLSSAACWFEFGGLAFWHTHCLVAEILFWHTRSLLTTKKYSKHDSKVLSCNFHFPTYTHLTCAPCAPRKMTSTVLAIGVSLVTWQKHPLFNGGFNGKINCKWGILYCHEWTPED